MWLGIYGVAKATGNWDSTIPAQVFQLVINSGLLENRTPTGFLDKRPAEGNGTAPAVRGGRPRWSPDAVAPAA